jgi:hypothetical protein
MFENKIRSVNPDVPIVQFNGLNGNGSLMLKYIIDEVKEVDEIIDQLCYSSPASA